MHEASPDRVKRIYSLIADEYTRRYCDDRFDTPIVAALIEVLPRGGHVLDVGCGPGTFTQLLSDEGFEVVGIDLSPDMLAQAKRRSPHVALHEMDMRTLEFDDTSFDGILAAFSLIHIPDNEISQVLSEFHRVLRPNGALLIIGQLGEPDHVENEPLASGEQIFVNFFELDRLETHLEAADFRIDVLSSRPTNDSDSMSDGIAWALARPNPSTRT